PATDAERDACDAAIQPCTRSEESAIADFFVCAFTCDDDGKEPVFDEITACLGGLGDVSEACLDSAIGATPAGI
ncbi:MAG: hypothetical protein AAF211_23115, partial [Myxococcota bacterium]